MPKLYITKWAPTRGIIVVYAKIDKPLSPAGYIERAWVCTPGRRYKQSFLLDREVFLTEKAARANAKERFRIALERAQGNLTYLREGFAQINKLLVHKPSTPVQDCHAFRDLRVQSEGVPIVKPPRSKQTSEEPMLFCADPKFGLNHQALAILAFLSGLPPSFAPYDPKTGRYDVNIQTFPWYSGLETGVALVVHRNWTAEGRCMVIAFGECRKTDQIFVEHWEEPREPPNGPTVERRDRLKGLKMGAVRTTFDRGEVGAAADQVYALMERFYSEQPKKVAK